MSAHAGEVSAPSNPDGTVGEDGAWLHTAARHCRGHILVVDDDELLREATGPVLADEGYDVSFATNGKEALRSMEGEHLPDLILLDLRMPVMDGWEFRAIQKDDPRLGLIPVIAVSADGSAQAAAISAQAYLQKPIESDDLLNSIGRVLLETELQKTARADDTERLASLGRLAANIGHEINNPLAFVSLNLELSLRVLETAAPAPAPQAPSPPADEQLRAIKIKLADVREMLQECQLGSGRIRETVGNLQRLSRGGETHRVPIDVHQLIEQSISIAWNQIRHRGRLVKSFGRVPLIFGNSVELGQVFLNLLINAAQAIPEGATEANEIRISTQVRPGKDAAGRRVGGDGRRARAGAPGGRSDARDERRASPRRGGVADELVVEIGDTGGGMTPTIVSHIFEPFFTTKPRGQGTGLGLSISRQTVLDHGGRLTVESEVGKGTVFRVFLPTSSDLSRTPPPLASTATPAPGARGRILVIDDEAAIGRAICTSLKGEHDIVTVQRASEALTRLKNGEEFDLVLCDVVMPDLTGPQFFEMVTQQWPTLAQRLVFMTGGAFTSTTVEFLKNLTTPVLPKPFTTKALRRLVSTTLEAGSRA